jgi:mycothiol synthase
MILEGLRVPQLVMRRPHLRDVPAVAPLPAGYRLRPFADPADVAALAATLATAFDEPWDEARVRRELADAPDVKAVYVVTWQGNPVATASSRSLPDRFPGSGYVHWVGTDPAHARRGLASALLARLLRDFAERRYADAVLETDDARLPALRTYLRFGFLPVYAVQGEDQRDRWAAIFQRLFAG